MNHRRAVDLIAQRLTQGVMHPGDPTKDQPAKLLLPLPGFNTSGMPPEMVKHFAEEAGLPSNDAAQLYAEAIVHALETDGGIELIDKAQIEQLREKATTLEDAPPGTSADVCCHCNLRTPILTIPTGRPRAVIDGKMLDQRLREVCTCVQ